MMVYNNTPAAVMALKKSGIKSPADLAGKKLGAPVFDAGRRGFPIFQKANQIPAVTWVSMDPPLRETMLARGEVDAITGFTFTSLLNLEARGVKLANVVTLPYPQYGVKLYGNVIIASPKLVRENPQAIKAFLAAFAKGEGGDGQSRRGGGDHQGARRHRQHRAGEAALQDGDQRRDRQPRRPGGGFGQVDPARLTLMASQVSDAFNTKTRVKADEVWNGSFLPAKADLNVFPAKK